MRILWPRFTLSLLVLNAIKFLQTENIFVLTEALQYHKQLSTSLIAVGDIIIGNSFDKLVKAKEVKFPQSDDVMDHRVTDPTVWRVWHGLRQIQTLLKLFTLYHTKIALFFDKFLEFQIWLHKEDVLCLLYNSWVLPLHNFSLVMDLEPASFAESWLLKDPGHQQKCCWPSQ